MKPCRYDQQPVDDYTGGRRSVSCAIPLPSSTWRAAREDGLDLDGLRRRDLRPAQWLDALFHDGNDEEVDAFFRFRSRSVARLVDAAAAEVRGAGIPGTV